MSKRLDMGPGEGGRKGGTLPLGERKKASLPVEGFQGSGHSGQNDGAADHLLRPLLRNLAEQAYGVQHRPAGAKPSMKIQTYSANSGKGIQVDLDVEARPDGAVSRMVCGAYAWQRVCRHSKGRWWLELRNGRD